MTLAIDPQAGDIWAYAESPDIGVDYEDRRHVVGASPERLALMGVISSERRDFLIPASRQTEEGRSTSRDHSHARADRHYRAI